MPDKRIESNDSSEESQNVSISRDEYQTFLNTKLREELKSDLISWAKRQAWIIVMIISVIGIFGVSFIIESTVRKKVENEVKEAKEAIRPAREAAIAAQLETQNARDALSALKQQRKEVESALVSLQEKAEDLRDSFAAFEADINNVRTWSKNMQDQIELIIEKSALLNNEEILEKRKYTLEFEAKSKFSVLVFYRHKRKNDAIQITEGLISSGYRSSRTPTDLSEAINQYPPGSIWVIYTPKGERILEKIKTELDGLGLKDTLQINPNPVSLRNGDMQLLLF